MTGLGGLPPPRQDQLYRPPASPSPVGSAAGILRAREVIIIGANGGIFQYSPTAALGNLVNASAPVAGTDIYGNAYLEGTASYAPAGGAYVASVLQNGGLYFYANTSYGGSYTAYGVIDFNAPDETMEFSGADTFLFVGGVTIGNASTGLSFLPASGDTSGATDTAALAAIISDGLTPWLLPGQFYLDCGNATLTGLGPGQYIAGSGHRNTFISAIGSGDLFHWSYSGSYSPTTTVGGGIIGPGDAMACTIDGTATTGSATAVHAGDIESLRFAFAVQNFTAGTASWGFLGDNAHHFTERMRLQVWAKNCGNSGSTGGHVGFTVSGGTTSFARLVADVYVTQNNNQFDGLVLSDGAHIYDSKVYYAGNFTGGSSATTAAACRISGSSGGTESNISNSELVWGVECSAGSNTPTDLIIGTSGGGIINCFGGMDWNENFTAASIASGGSFKFDGQVQGDAILGTRRAWGETALQTIATGATINTITTSAVIPVGGFVAAITGVIMQAGDSAGQVVWVVNTATAGITFDIPGTSNVAAGSNTIAASTSRAFVWDTNTNLWH